MPCYCDVPDENNQAEIEKRAKKRMYFDATTLVTQEQADEHQLCFAPLPDENTALCKICKILTEKQMKTISAYQYQIKWPHKTLHDWYVKHLEDDRIHNNALGLKNDRI
jgi:hypothetical protein